MVTQTDLFTSDSKQKYHGVSSSEFRFSLCFATQNEALKQKQEVSAHVVNEDTKS